MENNDISDLVVEFASWLNSQQTSDENIESIDPIKVSILLKNVNEKEEDSLGSYEISDEQLLIAVAVNLLASVIKDGAKAYLSNKAKYHDIVKHKAKELSINNIKKLEYILRYISLWIDDKADMISKLHNSLNED